VKHHNKYLSLPINQLLVKH